MPDYVPAMYGKWYANILLGNFEIAESCMKNWIAEHTELKIKVIKVARKLMMAGKFEIIIHAIGPIANEVDDAESYSALGAAYLWANRINEAESNLEKALALDKTLNPARVNLAQIKEVHRKDTLTATKLYEEALQYEPQSEFVQARIKLLKNMC
jgi:Flp pilus assembly protein TadD